MNYTVVWVRKAKDELATVWLSAVDRGAVARAANSLTTRCGKIRQRSVSRGQVDDELRIPCHWGSDSEILEDDRLVRVLAVWPCAHIEN